MNTREDLLKWLDDNRAFKDPERKTLSSSIARILNKNKSIKEDFKRVTRLDSDNSTELIYNVVFPNQARVCEVCGKPVKFSAYYLGYKKTCSLSCAGKSANQKGASVKLERYGSVNNRKKVEETKFERYGDPNYNNRNQARETCFKRYGGPTGNHDPAIKAKIRETNNKLHNGQYSQNELFYYYGQSFHSSWELAVWIYCIDNNVPIIRDPCMFEYNDSNGETHSYTPDFMIDGKLVEIKGDQYFKEDGIMRFPYNKKKINNKWIDMTYEEKLYYNDLYERKHQCGLEHGVEFWRKKDIKPYIDYCNKKCPNWDTAFRKDSFYNPSYWCFNIINIGYPQPQYFIPISQQGINPYDINKDDEYHFVSDKGLTPFDIK